MDSYNIFQNFINTLLIYMGCSEAFAAIANRWFGLIFIIVFAILADIFFNKGILRIIRNIVTHTKAKWDDTLLNRMVVRRMCNIMTPILIYVLLPIAFMPHDGNIDWIYTMLKRVTEIYLVIACTRFGFALVNASFDLIEQRPTWQGKPLRGLAQTGYVIIACIAIILVLAIILDRSPTMLLTGIGASAAVLMLIFKDSILGLVAGVQLSANNMLKVGDWIAMSQYGIDGVVEEVALTTIKIRAWDNTLQTLPPYLLISEPFDNWQAMRDSGGRRIKRSLNIDMTSVRFADSDLVEKLTSGEHTQELMRQIEQQRTDGKSITNLDLYMWCMNRYIINHPDINHDMLILVRQLQPNQWGLPIEFYCFSANVNWVPYENLQSEIISYVVATAPLFDLRIHQAPSQFGTQQEMIETE